MREIPGYDGFAHILPVEKGWSGERKYRIETQGGERLLLRISAAGSYERKQAEFALMQRIAALCLPTPQPVAFGRCEGGESVYLLLTWCDGEDAELVLPTLSGAAQYELGVRSGELLQRLHSLPAPGGQEDWAVRFGRKTDYKISAYRACGLRFEGDDDVIAYLEANRGLLKGRPQCFHHGDYHVGNMVIYEASRLSVIDFNRFDFGDPWEEFNRIVWSAAASPLFATGQLNAYFGGRPPMEFFRLLAFYIAGNTLSSIYWAAPFGPSDLATMMGQAQDVLRWFDGMQNPVPSWYLGPPR